MVVRYWFAYIEERGPRGGRKPPPARPDPNAPALWQPPQASTEIPRVGDRVFFSRAVKPLGRMAHFNWIGLAEIRSVASSDDLGRPIVGFTTVTPLHAFVPRGDSWETIEKPAISALRGMAAWGVLSEDKALALFRYGEKASDVGLPGWFTSAAIAFAPPEEPLDPILLDERKRVLREIVARQGQETFRAVLLDAYERRCAMTGCAVEAVLEAAHVVPYLGPSTNAVSNGLLLRADVHSLFDLDLVSVDPERLAIQVSPLLKGSEYWSLNGMALRSPASPADRPTASAFQERRRLLDRTLTNANALRRLDPGS